MDYDSGPPNAKKRMILAAREAARQQRLEKDAENDREWATRDAERLRRKRVWSKVKRDRLHAEIEEENFARENRPRCRYCGGPMGLATRKPQQGMGCLLVVVGLCLVVVILGIPLLIYGLYLSGKEERYLACQKCGCAG